MRSQWFFCTLLMMLVSTVVVRAAFTTRTDKEVEGMVTEVTKDKLEVAFSVNLQHQRR